MSTNFKEFEHKYVLDEHFDVNPVFEQLRSLGNGKEKQLTVKDVYYRSQNFPDFVFRHRKDEEIQQLTVKSYGGDTRERTEVNLHLKNDRAQFGEVEAFLDAIGSFRKFEISKEIRVIDFPDCECVYYKASSNDNSVYCMEFEALGTNDLSEALLIIKKYEAVAGFESLQRCHISLFDILFNEQEY
jgi:hypothetical protein